MIFIILSVIALAILLFVIHLKYALLFAWDDAADIRIHCETPEARLKRINREFIQGLAFFSIIFYTLALATYIYIHFAIIYLTQR